MMYLLSLESSSSLGCIRSNLFTGLQSSCKRFGAIMGTPIFALLMMLLIGNQPLECYYILEAF
jgi:hypothetical protein